MKKIWSLLIACFLSLPASHLCFAGNVSSLSYSSTNVTTSAYVTLVASTPITVSRLQICDTSGKVLKLATGDSGSEADLCTVQVSGCVIVPVYLIQGIRLSIKAIDASATTGYNTVSFLQ